MIELIFTLDYEIYGDGSGSLNELVYEPAEELRRIFRKWDARFVNFVEVAEFERIEECKADSSIASVRKQIQEMYQEGFEIALHLHPQWYNAGLEGGKWAVDYAEYNLCALPRTRIVEIVEKALDYLQKVLGEPRFTPLSFRAGNWCFQPTRMAAGVLAEHGIRVDSSVFKGGLQRNHQIDYRPSRKNGYYWPFSEDVNQVDESGSWMEVPIHSEMVPLWRMLSGKRIGLRRNLGMTGRNAGHKINRMLDFMRFCYPLKLDFCRMSLSELIAMVERVRAEDRKEPGSCKPIVAIGHTKDLVDPDTVGDFLGYLRKSEIAVSTFASVYPKLTQGRHLTEAVRVCAVVQ